jgi:DNA uptake protein ComE-like DNA-binding protein
MGPIRAGPLLPLSEKAPMSTPIPNVLSLILAFLPAAALQQAPASQPAASQPSGSAGPQLTEPSDKRSPKEVVIKKECGVLEDVFKHRSALHYLKNDKDAREAILKTIDPESANAVKSFLERDERFTELDYHYGEKIKNSEARILERLRSDKFQGVADLLEAVKSKQYPASVAFANLMNTVELNFRYGVRNKLVNDDEMVKDLGPKLTAEALRIEGTAGHSIEEIAKAYWKETKPDDFPASWFDPSSEIVSYEFGEIPIARDFPRVDLATATKEQLTAIPGLEEEMADAILKYRKRNNIVGVEELRLVEAIPAYLVDPLGSVCTVNRGAQPAKTKKWTVMVFLNAANNLEPFGIKDMNEMEMVGSTPDVNVVVELARYQGKQAVKPNGQYLSNPYSEFSGQFYIGMDNTPGTRRYYVLKDSDKARLRSVMLMNVGETDAGRPEPLANFGKWAVENFPAEHYALVIWNHGAGWSGVSYDDNTHHGMDLPEVREALEGICGSLKRQNKEHIDILDFDACLMATLEVGFELRNTVDTLVASQEVEPGDGNPYTDWLKFLSQYPEAPPAAIAKSLVEAYINSYAPNGSQAGGGGAPTGEERWNGGAETKSAIRLSKMVETRDAVEAVAKILQGKTDLLGDVAEDILKDARRYGRLVDIQDFFTKVAEHEKSDAALKAAVERVQDLIGYPNDGKDKLVNEAVISRRSPGAVIWGFNGWATPPRNLAPFVYQSRFAKTPLTGPDEKGNYVAKLKFPPMLRNNKTQKMEFVKEINYRFDDDQEKRTLKDFENKFFTTEFTPTSAILAEGHMIGNNRSHGLSLYFPAYLGFDKEYRRLQFSDGSTWAALCEKFPLRKIEKPHEVALLGLNHATKADREALGAIVVREELDKKLRKQDWASPYGEDLKKLSLGFDSIRDPRPYGLDWAGMLEVFKEGIVVLDNHVGGEITAEGLESMDPNNPRPRGPRVVGPDGRNAMRFLRNGGRLLVGSAAATQTVWDTPFYRDTLGLEYVEKWDRGYEFTLEGAPNAKAPAEATASKDSKANPKYSIECARKGEPITIFQKRDGAAGDGVEPFAVLPDGRWIGAKISRVDPNTSKLYKAVVLGFYLADVKGADSRRAILKEALTFLGAEGIKKDSPASPGPEATPNPNIGAAQPASAGTGNEKEDK